MPNPAFVHLRLHSEYSITDGIVRIDDAVAKAAGDGMPALAVTDLANVFGLVKFYKAARSAGIKPVAGCDVWLTNETERDKPYRLLLLIQSYQGYLKLCDWLTRAWLDNQHRGRAEVRKAWFSENGTEGIIALSGSMQGDVGMALLQGNAAQAERLAQEWSGLFPGRYYIELQRAGAPQGEAYVEAAIQLAGRAGLPVVATHPVQFLQPHEFTAHEARVCIAEGYVLSDQRRPKLFTPQSYFLSQAEMAKLFADVPEALANSIEIARRCNLALPLGKSKLPLFPTPDGISLDDYMLAQAKEGLERRLAVLYPDAELRAKAEPRYQERVIFEANTIVQMGFSGYFLIVADFINWAKQNGVPVGPGRGSGAGSLIAYSLGITDIDPLRYDLLFERFLNPERVSMPDFDIDFCERGRDRVIEYVKQKYGAQSVSQIATFGTMAAKAVVRDVGRVMEWGYSRTDELAKLIPFQPGKKITLKDARDMEPKLREREETEEETRELLALAEQLEGISRNVGMHAGGVLIAPGKLTDFCPLYSAQGAADSVVSQFDMKDVEKIGLVKFDFLGLTTLTILDWAVEYIHLMGNKDFDLQKIALDDPASYEIFGTGNTTAVFQSESRSAKDIERKLKPDTFEDLIALMALNRPGPLQSGMVDDFIARKHKRQAVDLFHPSLEPVLKPTYGVIVYQEQVMQIAQVLAGYTLGGADLLRRAMGKKNAEEMGQQRAIFVQGATERGIKQQLAETLFALMEKFAEYGFNKSHSAAYALIAYQTAYLKAHYPAEFMAANLSAIMDDTDKVSIFYQDVLVNGLKLLPPDVNVSQYRFMPVDAKTLRYGLGGVKGTGESAIDAIVKTREGEGQQRPFKDLFDFCRRVDKRLVNRRVIEALVRAGAFDSIHDNRAELLASVGIAMEAAEQQERDVNQVSLFGGSAESPAHQPALVSTARWSEKDKLQHEKTALGFYFSGHPFAVYRRYLNGFIKGRLADLAPRSESQLLAGIVAGTRTVMTRRGKMGIVALDDGTAVVDVTVYSELFDAHRDLLKTDQPLVIMGKAQHDEFSGGIRVVADSLYDLVSARSRFAREMRLSMNGEASRAGSAAGAKLRSLLAPYRKGPCPIAVRYENPEACVEVRLGDDWRVSLDDRLLEALGEWLKPENVEVLYQ